MAAGRDGVVVSDHHDRRAAMSGRADEQVDHLGTSRRVERTGRLVGEDGLRFTDERPGDRHALRLATGEFAGTPSGFICETDLSQYCAGPADRLAPGDAVDHQRQGDVLVGGEFGEELVVLEDEAEPATPQYRPGRVVQLVDPLTTEPDLALIRTENAGQNMQQGRLAIAARPHHRKRLTRANRDINASQTNNLPVILHQTAPGQHRAVVRELLDPLLARLLTRLLELPARLLTELLGRLLDRLTELLTRLLELPARLLDRLTELLGWLVTGLLVRGVGTRVAHTRRLS